MPMYDRTCYDCGATKIDCYEPIVHDDPACSCGGVLVRCFTSNRSAGVIDDSIPGGIYIKHGLCNPDGTPRRFDSHTDIKKAAKEAGLVNHVEHKPGRGSDKSKHTVRWV